MSNFLFQNTDITFHTTKKNCKIISSTAIDLFLNLLGKKANRSPGLGGFQLNS